MQNATTVLTILDVLYYYMPSYFERVTQPKMDFCVIGRDPSTSGFLQLFGAPAGRSFYILGMAITASPIKLWWSAD